MSLRSFTLVELVLAIGLAAILLIGLQSAVLMASKAVPQPLGATADPQAQTAALDRLAFDLSYAKVITQLQANSITLVVSDRNGDANDDQIVYSWSGVSGDPCLRTMNAAPPESLVMDVKAFAIAPVTEVVASESTYIDSNETLLAVHNSSSNRSEMSLDAATWIAQSTPVTLPADAVDFRTTRLRLLVEKPSGNSGITTVHLRSFRQQLPTPRTLATATFLASSLSGNLAWYSWPLVSSRSLDPNEPIGLVIWPSASPPSCGICYRSGGAPASVGRWGISSNQGATWTATTGRALLYELWGVYRTRVSGPASTRMTFVRLTIQAAAHNPVEINLPLLNRPVVRQ